MSGQLLTVKEAAPLLRLSAAALYALCSARRIRHQRVGLGRGRIVIPADAIAEYLSQATVTGAGAAPEPRAGIPKSLTTFRHLDADRLLAAWKTQGKA